MIIIYQNILIILNIFAEIYMPNAVKEHNGLFEKKQIRWFKLDEFKNINKKNIKTLVSSNY